MVLPGSLSHRVLLRHCAYFKPGICRAVLIRHQQKVLQSSCSNQSIIKNGPKSFGCTFQRPLLNSSIALGMKRQVRCYSLPAYQKLLLPALSPTMETGTIVQWQVKEGDHFEVGDLLAEIETDKATMGFEAIDEGYIAKIIVKEGTKDIPLGTLLAVAVDDKEDLAAFKDVSVEDLGGASAGTSVGSDKGVAEAPATPVSQESSAPTQTNADYPVHDRVLLPALSPTMTTGTIVAWEKQVGDQIEEGDPIATIETDKASMALEYQEEGFLAKILVKEGVKDLPLGTPLCIIVSNKEDIGAFASYTDSGAPSTPASPPVQEPPKEQPAGAAPPVPVAITSTSPVTRKLEGDRLFVSPFAKKLAAEQQIDLSQLAGLGSGPHGRIRAQDLSKIPADVPKVAATQPTVDAPIQPTSVADGDFVDIPLSNIRKITAKRLLESKQTIPHYYLTVDVEMDEVIEIRKSFNKELEAEGVKLSVNDFIIKASALSCLKVPEANSSWRDTFIRKFNKVDMSVAVSTESGLITPIVFNADTKGLISISQDVISLAAKAREGKLQPHEFQGGTFTISNLGMFGIKHFSAIINPPQACILAVGSARREFLPDPNAENGMREATLMSVTLSCDHRVVDGAVGAQWLQRFKKFLEDPIKMIL